MRATALLVRQHRKIEGLVQALDGDLPFEPGQRRVVLLSLVDELIAHMAVEQRIFYPCAERAVDADLSRNRDTHRRARATLLRLANPHLDDVHFSEEVARLKAILEEHFTLEDNALFVAIEQVADSYALDRLGERMSAFHTAILSRPEANGPAKADSVRPPIALASRLS